MRYCTGILRFVSLLCVMAACAAGYWACLPAAALKLNSDPSSPVATAAAVPGQVSLAELEPLLDQRLRPPLYDPPPPPKPTPPAPVAPPPLRLSIKLIGTIVEGNQSRALLASPTGDIEIRGVGEMVTLQAGNLVIEKVSSDQVVLRVPNRQQPVTLELQAEAGE